MMASFRRTINRKRRCLLICFLGFCILISSSWIMSRDESSSPIIEDNLTKPDAFIHPKFNVLPEPPKPPTHSTLPSKKEKEKPVIDPKTRNDSAKNDSVHHVPTILKQSENKSKEIIAIKSEGKPASNESVKIEIAKNKTMAQMAVLGLKKPGNISNKIIFAQQKWNLSVSFEDIGNVMKDTSFFNNLKPLDMSGPLLSSTKNRTANFSLSMPIKMGYCDCWELYCFCCVQLVNKQLHLNAKSCANFTFISKSHELDVTFSLDGVKVHRQMISADIPPLLCMGSIPKVADMCVHFSNMTYRVDALGMHKSQLMGCTDFSFNIYNKTVNVYPVDCFQIPGDPNHHPKHEQIILPNFVP